MMYFETSVPRLVCKVKITTRMTMQLTMYSPRGWGGASLSGTDVKMDVRGLTNLVIFTLKLFHFGIFGFGTF